MKQKSDTNKLERRSEVLNGAQKSEYGLGACSSLAVALLSLDSEAMWQTETSLLFQLHSFPCIMFSTKFPRMLVDGDTPNHRVLG